jgi:hypothetical protein
MVILVSVKKKNLEYFNSSYCKRYFKNTITGIFHASQVLVYFNPGFDINVSPVAQGLVISQIYLDYQW